MNRTAMAAWALAAAVVAPGTAHATFLGENGVIVYQGLDGGIWRAQSDGSNPKRIVASGFMPSASPNGRKLAYYQQVSMISNQVAVDRNRLHVMNIDGSGDIDIGEGYAPTWSPDGQTIAFYSAAANPYGAFVVAATGGTAKRVSSSTALASTLDWSPLDARHVAVGIDQDEIDLLDLGSGAVSILASVWNPAWFPDGRALLATVAPDASGSCLVKLAPDGSGRKALPLCPQTARVAPNGTKVLGVSADASLWTWSLGPAPVIKPLNISGRNPDWSRVPRTAMLTTRSPDGAWSPAAAVAGDVDAYSERAADAVSPAPDAVLLRHFVSVGVDGLVRHRAQLRSGRWTASAVVPGIDTAGLLARTVAAAADLRGQLHVVALGAFDEVVYHNLRHADGSWSGFRPVKGPGGAASFTARDVAVTIVDGETLHMAALGSADGRVLHAVRLPDGSWTPWTPVPGSLPSGTFSIALAASAATRNVHLLVTVDNEAIQRQMRRPNGSWEPEWIRVSKVPGTARGLSLGVDTNNVAWLAYIDPDGNAWSQERRDPDSGPSWQNPNATSTLVMSQGRSVSVATGPIGDQVEIVAVQAQAQ